MPTSAVAPPVATAPNADFSRIVKIYEAQKANLQALKDESLELRIKKLMRLEKAILAHRTEIEQALYNDFRKPALHTDFSEIYPAVSDCRLYRKNLYNWAQPEEVDTPLAYTGSTAKIIYEPKGRCLIITPWNYPFQMPIRALISAVAAGNAALLKPSEYTPHTAAVIQKVVSAVFKENEAYVVTGDYTVSQSLLDLRFDHIHFTGSPAIGKQIMRAASEHLTSVTLELGGKSPVIIDRTANLKKVARNLIFSKYLNSGQTCIAADYVFVEASVQAAFIQELKTAITKAFGEQPQNDRAAYCRIVNSRHVARVASLIEDAVAKGARIEAGGQVDAADNYIAPTVLTQVNGDMRVMQEEIFGPVLPVIPFQQVQEAVQHINAGEKPLALYIFSSDRKTQEYIIQHTSSGAVGINESMIQNTYGTIPFGGVNNSGIGKSYGVWGFKDFSNEKPVVKAWLPPTDLLTPPYNGFSETIVNTMLKFL
ncbi:MAG: aldehyde dehydrogenase family protein [Chitinophagales bacterium]